MIVIFTLFSNLSFAAIDSQVLRQLDIQRGLFADEYQMTEIAGQQYLYVLQESAKPITRGVAVLISDAGKSMVSQQSLAPLATNLNKLGWTTVLLSAPDTAFTPHLINDAADTAATEEPRTETTEVPASIENTQAADDPNSAETSTTENAATAPTNVIANVHSKTAESGLHSLVFQQHEQDLISLLQVAEQTKEQYPGFFLVIAQGTSAAWLAKIYAELTTTPPDAFVAISPFWPDRNYNRHLPQLMATTSMPVLDIYSANDNGWALKTAKLRQTAAVNALKLHYRQRQLLGTPQSLQKAHYLAKEIHGWLSNMGW